MADVVRAQLLRSLVHRIERMDEEIEAARSDRKEIVAEAKALGFDTKIMGMLIRIRKMEPADYEAQQSTLETYIEAMKVPEPIADTARVTLRVMHEEAQGASATQ